MTTPVSSQEQLVAAPGHLAGRAVTVALLVVLTAVACLSGLAGALVGRY